MRRLVTILAACAALVAGAAPASQAWAQNSAADQRLAQDVNAYMTEMARWAEGYHQITRDQMVQLQRLNEGAVTALEHFEKGTHAEGRAWARTFMAEQRNAQAALRARLEALPPTRPQARMPDVMRSSAMTATVRFFDTIPAQTRNRLDMAEKMQARYWELIERAAGGDQDAAGGLAVAYFDVNIAILNSQISTTESYLAVLSMAESPQRHVISSSLHALKAMLATYGALRSQMLAEPFDRRAAAATVRAEAAGVDRDTDAIAGVIREGERANLPGEFGQKIRLIMASFGESRVVMAELAGRLRSIADAIEAGPELDLERVATVSDAVLPVMQTLSEHDTRRKAILTR